MVVPVVACTCDPFLYLPTASPPENHVRTYLRTYVYIVSGRGEESHRLHDGVRIERGLWGAEGDIQQQVKFWERERETQPSPNGSQNVTQGSQAAGGGRIQLVGEVDGGDDSVSRLMGETAAP